MRWYITYKWANRWYLYSRLRVSFEEATYVAKVLNEHPLIRKIHISTGPKRLFQPIQKDDLIISIDPDRRPNV